MDITLEIAHFLRKNRQIKLKEKDTRGYIIPGLRLNKGVKMKIMSGLKNMVKEG